MMLTLHRNKAFTMLELVFAIVVIGILASLAMPRIDRDIRQEAADNVLSAIRYTQHMALMDNIQGDINPATTVAFRTNWQRAFWSFGTQSCAGGAGLFYYVASDNLNRNGNINATEEAIDPTNGLPMLGVNNQACDIRAQAGRSPNIFLTKKYGINNVNWSACNPVGGNGLWQQHIAFDYMGRLHRNIRGATNNYATYVNPLVDGVCDIVFNFSDVSINPFTIRILPETGYAFIVNQPDS